MNLSPQILTPAIVDPSSPVSPPTRHETLHLASLVPLHVEKNPETVPQIASKVFSLCRHRWVSDFLFSNDMTPLSALTAPVNLHHSIACTVTMTSVERLIGLPRCPNAPPNPFDIHMHGDYVFVPAFSVGPISVGFGIQNCAVKCHADWSLRPGQRHNTALNHFRYARDDQKGILLNVHYEKDCDFCKIDYMEHQTTIKRCRAFLTMDRSAIQNLLSSDPAGLDPLKLVTGIRLVQFAEEFRNCPICGQQKDSSCSCALQLKVSKHPLDFDNMIINMSSHLGSFEGVTEAKFCTAGMELVSARLGSRITIDCRVDNDLLDRLSKWAITDQLKDIKEDPLKCIMPPADEEMADTRFGVASGDEISDIGVGKDMTDRDLHAILEMDSLVDEAIRPVKGARFADAGTNGIERLPTYEVLETLSPASTEGDEDVLLANEIAREAQLAYQAENEVGEHSVPSGASTIVVQGLDEFDLHDDVQQLEEARMQQEKERKAELRRQRNRLAAQRSNAKRKEKNDTLKAELLASHNKAAELRAKELVLREENIRLRKMLSP